MLARRRMLGTTLFGGLLGAAIPASLSARSRTAAEAEAGPADQSNQTSDRQLTEIADALKDLRKAIEAPQGAFVEVLPIRQKQMDYLQVDEQVSRFHRRRAGYLVCRPRLAHQAPAAAGPRARRQRPLHDFADGHAARDAARSGADLYQRAVR